MTQVSEVYLCEICGNKVEVKEAGAGQLVCCGQPMALFVMVGWDYSCFMLRLSLRSNTDKND